MRSQCLPFVEIPHSSKLFTDFLSYSEKVQTFYPHTPRFSDWFKQAAKSIAYDSTRRKSVCDALHRQNVSWDASPRTLENISRLRAGAVTVVTGQQVGLFGGPLFSLLKALTAVKLAAEATAAGVDCVPVFWLATEDHDLDEVNHVGIPAPDGSIPRVASSSAGTLHAAVGTIKFGNEIETAVKEAADLLGESEVTALLRRAYSPGATFGTAFARLFAQIFADWGVILLDASDPDLHRIAEPIYERAAVRSEDIARKLQQRGRELVAAGYEPQVKVTSSSTLLFSSVDEARVPVHRYTSAGGDEMTFSIGEEKLSQAQLADRIKRAPENFSPNVLLRPIVQDYLLPTLAYAGGAAEVSYFAQAAVVYEILLGKVTPIVPRLSATLVDSRHEALLERYNLQLPDLFHGVDTLRESLASATLPRDLNQSLDTAESVIAQSMSRVRENLSNLDKTLIDSANTAESKMVYQLHGLRAKAARAAVRHSEVLARHADSLSSALYPGKSLQEREIAGVYFLARHGMKLLHDLYETAHPDCLDHQVVFLRAETPHQAP